MRTNHGLLAFASRPRSVAPLLAIVGLAAAACGSTPETVTHEHEPVIAHVKTPPPPPLAERQDIVDTLHGVEVADPYRWLESVEDPRTRAWLTTQDDWARAVLHALPHRDALAARFRELFYVDAVSPPEVEGGRLFYTRRHKDREKAILYWRDGQDGAERVLIDPNLLSEDGSTSLGGWWPTQDGRRLAYTLKENNADEATMYIRDIDAGADLPDVIPGAKYASAQWLPDGSGFYYTFLPAGPDIAVAERPGHAEVRFHAVGTDPSDDPLVFPATGSAKTFVFPQLSRDGRWLLVYIQHGWNASDVFFADVRDGLPDPGTAPTSGAPPRDLAARVAANAVRHGFTPLVSGVEAHFDVSVHADVFYVRTDDGAPRYRVMRVDPADPDRAAWKELVPEGEDTLEGMGVLGGHLALRYLQNASDDVRLYALDGRLVHDVQLPAIGTIGGMNGRADLDTAYLSFSSFTRPPEVLSLDVSTGKTALWSRVELPVDTSAFEVKQVFYPSRDGTRVSMFIVHHRDVVLDGNNPTLLYGYGGFNLSLTPSYASSVVVWLERGGVYAVPNLRGGGEYGEEWHQAGAKTRKQNVFDDFIAAGEWLIANGWTRPERLAIRGGSNGGLLVGAAMTQRPDLFAAVICAVPLLDMVRFHLFGSGATWVPEYGSADDPEEFAAIHRYSPYHRVEKGVRYPALLMMTADSDDRVDPMHARKFSAAVRWAQADPNAPVITRVETNAGHGGADLVHQAVDSYADQLAFLMWRLGM